MLATISTALLVTVCAFNMIAYGNGDENVIVAEKYVNLDNVNDVQTSAISHVVDMNINDEQIIRVAVTDSYNNINYTTVENVSKLSTESQSIKDEDILVQDIIGSIKVAQQELDAEAELERIRIAEEAELARLRIEEEELANAREQLKARTYSTSKTQGGLLDISNPDQNYKSKPIRITGNDRVILEKLVMGESGNQGFEGSALVAQCIRDMYILGGFDSIESVRLNCGYSASLRHEPNQNVKDAVSFIFDEGGYAVKHRILYFYAPRYSKGSFHETQNLIINYSDHKFFDRRY